MKGGSGSGKSESKSIKAGQVLGPKEFQRLFLKLSLGECLSFKP